MAVSILMLPRVSFDVCIGISSHSCRRIHLNLGTKVEAKEEEERIHPPPRGLPPLPNDRFKDKHAA